VDGKDGTDGLLSELRRWATDQRVAEAARSRSRQRWLRQQAAEAATLLGVLVDLAERRATVTIEVAGQDLTGRLIAVSTGLGVLDSIDDSEHAVALVALPAITVLHACGDALGDRAPGLRLDLAGALAALAGDRPRVSLLVVGGKRVTGVLESVGIDVIGLRVNARAGSVVQVAVNAICACLL
jgi:hypothetical protein